MRVKTKTLRLIIVFVIIFVIGIGFILNGGVGTLSAIGWSDISLLCPLGALGSIIATKTFIPQALVSLLLAVWFFIFFARAFCAWACPVPLIGRLRGIFTKKSKKNAHMFSVLMPNDDLPMNDKKHVHTSITENEKKALKGCSTCGKKERTSNSRYLVLAGALLSTAIFGFPVFCVVCPIGLTFVTILLVFRLFAFGDVTFSLIVIPLMLFFEVVLFRKWCHALCPLSAMMSIVGKLNFTFRPTINDSSCLETTKHRDCGVCDKVCPEGINPRHPEQGVSWSECTKCKLCVDSCPTKSITMPFLSRRKQSSLGDLEKVDESKA